MPLSTTKVVNGLRGQIAFAEAVALQLAAQTLFQEVGQHVLSEGARETIHAAVMEAAGKKLTHAAPELVKLTTRRATAEVLPAAVSSAGKELAQTASREVIKTAATQVLKGAGRAAGLGLLLDGGLATVEAIYGYSTGRLDGGAACVHVLREAGTGAAASAGGVLLGVGLVALTGGVALPVLATVTVTGSIGLKLSLRSLFT
jgi:hypothetical protein